MVLQEAWAYSNIVSHFHERLNRQWHIFRLNVSENVPLAWNFVLISTTTRFQHLRPSPTHACRLWSTILFLHRHENYILKYLNVTLSLKLHPLPRLRPQRFDLRSDLNLNHEASLRPPCFCRKSAEKIRTVVTQWFEFLSQEWI